MTERWTFLWNDLIEAQAVTTFDTIDSPSISVALLQALCRYFLQDYWVGNLIKNAVPTPSSFSTYKSVREQAVIYYAGGDVTSLAQIRIPAPIFLTGHDFHDVFGENGYVADAGNLVDLTNDTFGRLVSAGNAVCDAFNGGLRFLDLQNQSQAIPGDGMSFIMT